VEETDWVIGEVKKRLDEVGITKDTLLYFSSDNGGDKMDFDELGRPSGGWNGIFRGL
jgi:arylsulfatase A-like enzyme